MTRVYAILGALGGVLLLALSLIGVGRKQAADAAENKAARDAADIRERMLDATQRQAGDSDGDIRKRLSKRPANTR